MDESAAPENGTQERVRAVKSPRRAMSRLVGIVLLALLAVYVTRVAGRLVLLQRAANAEAGLAAEVFALQTEVAALETAATESQSDEYVEYWAREERRWSRPGDQVVVVFDEPTTGAQGQNDDGSLFGWLREWIGGDASTPDTSPTADGDREDP